MTAREFGWTSVLLSSLLLTGCGVADQDDTADGRDDAFLAPDGKTDTGGILENSPESSGVLRVVWDVEYSDLMDKVRLSESAASNLLDYRCGPDGRLYTEDDRVVRTLAELDAIPWIGPQAFAKMLAYARAQGWTTSRGIAGVGTYSESSTYWQQTCRPWRNECDYPVTGGSSREEPMYAALDCTQDAADPSSLECSVSTRLAWTTWANPDWAMLGASLAGVIADDGSFSLEDEERSNGTEGSFSWHRFRISGSVEEGDPRILVVDEIDLSSGYEASGPVRESSTYRNSSARGLVVRGPLRATLAVSP